jgi:N-acetylneuraminic acid mutarotase
MYLFFGSGENGGLLQDVWEYDDFRHCWEPRLPASVQRPAARMEHSAVATVDDQFLVFGGRGGDGSTLLADLWRYAPLTRTWVQLADFPDGGRHGHAAVQLGGRMYVLGGTSAGGANNDIWVFDPGANAWAELTSDGETPGRFTGSAAAAGDFGAGARLMLVGGQDETGTDLGGAYSIEVDPINHLAHWTKQADHTAVFDAAAAAISRPAGQGIASDLLLFGGSAAGTSRDQASIYSTYVAPPPGADLTVAWVTQKRASKGAGAKQRWTLSGSVRVASQGTVKAGTTSMRLLLSADQTADGGDTLLKQVKVAALAPGRFKTVKWSAKLPAGQTGAGQYVVAVVDALAQVVESDEANNASPSALF